MPFCAVWVVRDGGKTERDMMMNTTLIAVVAGLALATVAHAEPSPEGNWSRGDGKAKVKIAPCGDDLCAVNTWIKAGTKNEKTGDKLVMTVAHSGDGHWKGKAYDPQRKLTYRLSMTVAESRMTTRGCVLGGLVCKGVDWKRLD